MTDISWMWRDTKDRMWVGDKNINDPWEAVSLPFCWLVNNKRANRREILAEWVAVRNNCMGLKVDEQFFRRYVSLYVPTEILISDRI